MSVKKNIRKADDRYTIGITIWIEPDGGFAFDTNGLKQNVGFLYKMFKSSPRCKKVYLVNHGPGDPGDLPDTAPIDKDAIVRSDKVSKKLDYLIVIGAAADAQSISELRKNGCKTIYYKGGNGGVIAIEAVISGSPDKDGERYFDANFFDAVWLTPQHMNTYAGWCETIYRCPIHQVPQIWDPSFLNLRSQDIIDRFGYKEGSAAWRIGILDPNNTVMKTSHMPVLVCETAFRKHPEKFKAIYVTNAIQYQTNNHFASFLGSLEASKKGVMTVEPRFVTWDFMANHADAVVTHHWENGLNYLYYEILYGNYPLIHNSKWLKGWGYYYNDFNAESGSNSLIEAMQTHDKRLPEYRANNSKLFHALNPVNEEVVQFHENLLFQCKSRFDTPAR